MMAGSVKRRVIVGEQIDDHPATWDEAEALAGHHLDRRKAYMIIHEQVCELSSWTAACTGCACDCGDGYPCSHGAAGCSECGYTGRRRWHAWSPIDIREAA